MSPEQKAQIARDNGAKSKGPKSEEGKAKSSRNALKDGEFAQKLAHLTPAHEAVLCHEDRHAFIDLVDELIAIYRPSNQISLAVIRDMATDRWQIERLKRALTAHWNLILLNASKNVTNIAPELHQLHADASAVTELLSGDQFLSRLNREIARLKLSLAQSERRLKFIAANYPDAAPSSKNKPTIRTTPTLQTQKLPTTKPRNLLFHETDVLCRLNNTDLVFTTLGLHRDHIVAAALVEPNV